MIGEESIYHSIRLTSATNDNMHLTYAFLFVIGFLHDVRKNDLRKNKMIDIGTEVNRLDHVPDIPISASFNKSRFIYTFEYILSFTYH